jgi:FKBP12-rapamycin complex-associated protein
MAIGKVAEAMGIKILPFLELTLQNIKEGLSVKGKFRTNSEGSIFQCISSLSIAVGPALTKHMHDTLDFMFQGGISSALIQALFDLSKHIPPLANSIRVRLLNLLSMILVGHPYQHPGAPNRVPPAIQPKDGTLVILFSLLL